MKIVRYIVGVFVFFCVWLVVAVVIGLGMVAIFPPPGRELTVGIGPEWRNLPGTFLGFAAGVWVFFAVVGRSKRAAAVR